MLDNYNQNDVRPTHEMTVFRPDARLKMKIADVRGQRPIHRRQRI
jgi:hypothetical protein